MADVLTMPKRIQRKRTKGWRMPEGAVYVGRPTIWGNPWLSTNPAYLVERYEQAVRGVLIGVLKPRDDNRLWDRFKGADRFQYELSQLRGRDLACWCPLVDDQGRPVPCHADVLLELSNGGT